MQNLSYEEYKALLENEYAVVDFSAVWCYPCKVFAPTFEKVSSDYSDRIAFGKVDVDLLDQPCRELGIDHIPTIVLFKNGEVVSTRTGVLPEEELVEELDALLA